MYSFCSEISKEIVPGPANMGIANGVIEIDSLVWMSFLIDAFSIPLCLLKLPVNSAKPEVAITNPPAIRKDSIEIPKKIKRYLPIKNEKNKITNALIAVRSEVLLFSF